MKATIIKNKHCLFLGFLILCFLCIHQVVFAQLPDIVYAEYFIDTDPGEGNGESILISQNSIINVDFDIDLSGLTTGFHKACFRAKDINGKWSLTNVTDIYIEESQAGLPLPDIIYAEYFIDTDPGEGNGESILISQDSIINVDFEIDLSGLSTGFHKTCFRTKDINGKWSLTNVTDIYVEESVGIISINEVSINNLIIYPNPFRNKTTISFNNPNNEVYTLCIFDLNGRKVSEIYDVRSNRIKFERGSLPEGVYFVELKGEKVYRGKMVVI